MSGFEFGTILRRWRKEEDRGARDWKSLALIIKIPLRNHSEVLFTGNNKIGIISLSFSLPLPPDQFFEVTDLKGKPT